MTYSQCKYCIDYQPSVLSNKDGSRGFCTRVSDCAGPTYFAYLDSKFKCLWNNPGKRITEDQWEDKLKAAIQDQANFEAALERAREHVIKMRNVKS